MKDKQIKRLMRATRRKGLSFYPHGVEFTLPTGDGEFTRLRFTGSFDRKRLRRMLRKSLEANPTVVELDFMIDNFMTKLRPMDKQEFHDLISKLEDEDASD